MIEFTKSILWFSNNFTNNVKVHSPVQCLFHVETNKAIYGNIAVHQSIMLIGLKSKTLIFFFVILGNEFSDKDAPIFADVIEVRQIDRY